VPAGVAGLGRQALVAVESGAELHLLAQSVDHVELPVFEAGDDHVEAVRAEIDRGDVIERGWHAGLLVSREERRRQPMAYH
jgi:hypothetical protein